MKKLSLMIWVFWLMLTFSVSYADQVNIAPIYGVASADTYWSDSLPGNAIDGDRVTLWNAGTWATVGSPHWLVIDLQGEFSVNSIVVVGVEHSLGFPWAFGYTNEYNLYKSTSGTDWTLVGSGTWAQDTDPDIYTNSYQLSGSPVRYIKYEVVGGSHWAAVHEIEVFAENVQPPVASTLPASEVTKRSATLKGSIADDGGEACQYRFRYKEEKGNYVYYTSWAGSVTVGQDFNEPISDLNPNATYYFNAQAKNSAGEGAWGDQQSFVARGIDFKIDQAGMISPHELGIAIKVEYPDYGYETTRKIKFSATINGKDVERVIDIKPFTEPGVVWKPGLIPTTPLKIDLADPDGDPETKDDIPKFAENQTFDLTGVAYCEEGGPAREKDPIQVRIPLPVVVLHGYPYGVPFLGGEDPLGYAVAYHGCTVFLTENGYNNEDTWDNYGVPAYRTLWDPQDFNYPDPPTAKTEDIEHALDGQLQKKVWVHNYATRVDFIGHSFGGLVARYYASVRSESVNKVITVGTPHTGATRFYEQAFSTTKEDFAKKFKADTIICWAIPKYECTYLKVKNENPWLNPLSVCPLFKNTLHAPDSGKGYYSIFASGCDTDKKLFLVKSGDWYRMSGEIERGPGDGLVLAESASAFGTDYDPFPVPEVRVKYGTHAELLNKDEVQKQILGLLQAN